MISRRNFIKWMGSIGAVLLTPIRHLSKSVPIDTTQDEQLGELYAGFVLLPENAPIPSFVTMPKVGIPNMCGVGQADGVPSPKAVTEKYGSVEQLSNAVNFPIYRPNVLPGNFRQGTFHIMRHETGEIYSTDIGYEEFNSKANRWQCNISLSALPDYIRPMPLWSSNPVEPGGPSNILEKTDILPSPGIQIKTQTGYVFYWIQEDIFYTMIIDPIPSKHTPATITRLLDLRK